MTSSVSQLGYVGLEVSDPEAWERFARDVLGLAPRGTDAAGARLFCMDAHAHRFALSQGPRDDLAVAGWQVEDGQALQAVARRLEQLGAHVTAGTAELAALRGVEGLFSVDDPSGVANEVFWGPRRLEEPFRSPRDIAGFRADALGLGHIVLNVDDYEASLRFYCDGLGLRISDYIDLAMGSGAVTRVAFLHAGARHHSLALAQVAATKRLHHLMLELIDPDDVGRTYDLCQDTGVPITGTLGRHTNDRMTSFYMRSPSGFRIEYGHGGVLIDDADWEVRCYDAASVWGHRAPG